MQIEFLDSYESEQLYECGKLHTYSEYLDLVARGTDLTQLVKFTGHVHYQFDLRATEEGREYRLMVELCVSPSSWHDPKHAPMLSIFCPEDEECEACWSEINENDQSALNRKIVQHVKSFLETTTTRNKITKDIMQKWPDQRKHFATLECQMVNNAPYGGS